MRPSDATLAGLFLASAVQAEPRLIGLTTFPRIVQGLAVGGLSGIDFDHRTGDWYLISDDRSEHGPARVWRAVIDSDDYGAITTTLLAEIPQRDGVGLN